MKRDFFLKSEIVRTGLGMDLDLHRMNEGF